jgi:hypothetical protein
MNRKERRAQASGKPRFGDDLSAQPGPIQEKYHAQMNGLAAALDEMLNGEGGAKAKPSGQRVGFFLAVFDMEHPGPAPGRFNYISNSDKTDVRAMMKEIEARISARLQAEGNA